MQDVSRHRRGCGSSEDASRHRRGVPRGSSRRGTAAGCHVDRPRTCRGTAAGCHVDRQRARRQRARRRKASSCRAGRARSVGGSFALPLPGDLRRRLGDWRLLGDFLRPGDRPRALLGVRPERVSTIFQRRARATATAVLGFNLDAASVATATAAASGGALASNSTRRVGASSKVLGRVGSTTGPNA